MRTEGTNRGYAVVHFCQRARYTVILLGTTITTVAAQVGLDESRVLEDSLTDGLFFIGHIGGTNRFQ